MAMVYCAFESVNSGDFHGVGVDVVCVVSEGHQKTRPKNGNAPQNIDRISVELFVKRYVTMNIHFQATDFHQM